MNEDKPYSFRWQVENGHLFDPLVFRNYPEMEKIFHRIGNTSLLPINSHSPANVKIFAKSEFENPWGTMKDRVAFALIYDLLAQNKITADTSIIEYTGGSLGLALSEICHRLQWPLEIVVADFVSPEFLEKVRRQNVAVHMVSKHEGFWGVMLKAFELAKAPHRHLLYQHENRSNPWIHEFSTGAEINHQLQRAGIAPSTPLYLVGSVGTGGSLHGIYRALKKNFNHVKIALTSPKELPYGSLEHPNGLPKFAGSGGLGEGRKQTFIYELEEEVIASYEYSYSEALEGCARYYDQTHQFIGSSSGANYLASLDLSHKLTAGVIVTLFPGGADTNEQAKIRSLSRTCEP